MPSTVVTIHDPLPSQALLISSVSRGEHCSVDPMLLANALAINPSALAALTGGQGFQIRIVRDPKNYALYTVVDASPSDAGTGIVRIGSKGLERIGITGGTAGLDGMPATISTEVLDVTPPLDFTEQLTDSGSDKSLAILAPHGGMIEQYTDSQAERVLAQLSKAGLAGLACWTCKGYRSGGGAYTRWHITSVDISEFSFPLLKSIMPSLPSTPPFTYAISFHGFTPTGATEAGASLVGETFHPPGYSVTPGFQTPVDILIGGHASSAQLPTLQKLQKAIQFDLQNSPEDTRVVVDVTPSPLGGNSPRNINSRLGDCTVQIEQSVAARDPSGPYGWEYIADVVATNLQLALKGILPDLP